MLELHSERWKELSHAYGSAEDIPALIEQLKTALPSEDYQSEDYQDEPWFSIWSALCHQTDVYTASYAALPHIVEIAAAKREEERLKHITFISSVEAFRHRKKAQMIPPDLEQAYFSALKQTESLILECLKLNWGEEEQYAILLGAFAVMRRQPHLGNAISELPEKARCPQCDTYVLPFGYDLNE
jgi:hypothetical protein